MRTIALILGAFYVVGLGLLGYGVWAVWRSWRATDWPTTPGTITELKLDTSSDSDGSTYVVRVGYRYAVDGTDYAGSRVAFGYGSDNREATHRAVHRKLQGAKSVAVRYDPDRPWVSCLSCGVHRSALFVVAFGATWLLFTSGFAVIAWLASGDDTVLLDRLLVQ